MRGPGTVTVSGSRSYPSRPQPAEEMQEPAAEEEEEEGPGEGTAISSVAPGTLYQRQSSRPFSLPSEHHPCGSLSVASARLCG